MIIDIPGPYLLFLGDVTDELSAKTACGIRDWRGEDCVGQYRLHAGVVDLGLPDLTPREARARGARSMVIGVANSGGYIPQTWRAGILAAIDAGLDVASGMHQRLADMAEVSAAARRAGVALHDVRQPRSSFPVGTGRRRPGRRLLTVGTDCAVGKKYTALAIDRELRRRGVPSDFRATGQTGLLISGRGIVIDAVVADFVAGAAEALSPDNRADHWDVVEGQGSLFHPSYAGVTLGLIHGSQPDALVVCHDPRRRHIDEMPDFAVPDVAECAARHVEAARLTNAQARCVGVSVNTSKMTAEEAAEYQRGVSSRMSVPCVDPMRDGVGAIVDRLLEAGRPASAGRP
jgi:uncharacterized NAD-dependent epimerase/dehydratase family protein